MKLIGKAGHRGACLLASDEFDAAPPVARVNLLVRSPSILQA